MPRRTTKTTAKRVAAPPAKKGRASSAKTAASGEFVLGHERFAKISAVEGITLTPEMKERARDFDARGLSPDERRREILKAYLKKA